MRPSVKDINSHISATRPHSFLSKSLQWHHNECDGVLNHLPTQPFIQTQVKENIKAPRHWPLCGNSPVTGEFPAQMASNAENVSIWWATNSLRIGRGYEKSSGFRVWLRFQMLFYSRPLGTLTNFGNLVHGGLFVFQKAVERTNKFV